MNALTEHGRRCEQIYAELGALRGDLRALRCQATQVQWITRATFAGVLALILRTFLGG